MKHSCLSEVVMGSFKQLKELLPDTFQKLHISDELAGCFDAGDRSGGMSRRPVALVVSPFGKVWPVEVDRDGDGAFLGRGWLEFASAHDIEVGWFVVLRHEGRGVLTVKAFDTSCLLKEFGSSLTVGAVRSETGGARRPQFIRMLLPDFMEKMPIPSEFLKRGYISEEQLDRQMAIVTTTLGKYLHIKLEKDQSGVFFSGGWSHFLKFHGVTEGEALLLRYEGNMLFKVKVFDLSGCQKGFKDQNVRIKQAEETNLLLQTVQTFAEMENEKETPSSCRKRSTNQVSSGEDQRMQKIPKDTFASSGEDKTMPKSSKTSFKRRSRCVCEIGPPSWIKKEINTNALERFLPLPTNFCNTIGFNQNCKITLKDSTKSWEVDGLAYGNRGRVLGNGWKIFCQDNELKEGDVCIFTMVEATLWHVIIERC